MNILVKKACTAALVVALLAAPAVSASAQNAGAADSKPVVVISFSGVDQITADLGYLSQVAGARAQGVKLASMVGGFTQGIDKTKPWGMVVTTNGAEFKTLVFVPVTDLQTVFAIVTQLVGPPSDEGDGVFKLSAPGPLGGTSDLFVKQQNGWVFCAQSKEELATLPNDPLALLDGLDKQYDIAVRAYINNIPAHFRDKATDFVKMGVQMGFMKAPQQDQTQIQQKAVDAQLNAITSLLNETDQFTLGWSINSTAKTTFLDFSFTAVPGTTLAKQSELFKNTKSAFAGFLLPDAALTFNSSSVSTQEDIQQSLTIFRSFRAATLKELENDLDLPDEQTRDAAKQVLNSAFDLAETLIEAGKGDGGMALSLEPSGLKAIAGFYVPDGNAVEALLKQLVDLGRAEPEFPEVKFNTETHREIRFHTLSIPIPGAQDEARQVLGDELELAFGIGAQSVYLALGEDSLPLLKSTIDRSAADADKTVPPMQFNVSLNSILKFFAAYDQHLATMVAQLGGGQGQDRISLKGKPIDNGITVRFQLDEGALKTISTMVEARMNAAAAGGPGF